MTDTTNPQQADRRERYAAAIREAEGWVLDDGQHMLDAVIAIADAEQAELRRERDLAIAHDRQPYPTAWAYEQVCTALNTHRNMAEVRRLGLAAALRLDNGAPWDTIRDRAAELAAPDDRAAILREAADAYDAIIDKSTGKEADPRYWSGVHDVAVGLRAMADAASGPGGVAGETQQPETQAFKVQVWPLARILAEVQCGSQDWTWDEEWADLDHYRAKELADLETQIKANGITEPVLIGSDGRLWNGHHRLRLAVRLGIGYVPVRVPAVVSQPDGEA
jgi:hypothetical protein